MFLEKRSFSKMEQLLTPTSINLSLNIIITKSSFCKFVVQVFSLSSMKN